MQLWGRQRRRTCGLYFSARAEKSCSSSAASMTPFPSTSACDFPPHQLASVTRRSVADSIVGGAKHATCTDPVDTFPDLFDSSCTPMTQLVKRRRKYSFADVFIFRSDDVEEIGSGIRYAPSSDRKINTSAEIYFRRGFTNFGASRWRSTRQLYLCCELTRPFLLLVSLSWEVRVI